MRLLLNPALAAGLLLSFCCSASFAAPADNEANAIVAEDSAKRALGERWDLNWYDNEADTFRPLDVPPPKKESDWKFWSWLGDLLSGLIELSFNWGDLFRLLAYAVLAGLVVMILVALYRALRKFDPNSDADDPEGEDAGRRIERVEALPVQPQRQLSDLLAEAARLRAAGDFAGAIVYLYGHLLLELDRGRHVVLVKGKTNRQYVRETRSSLPVAAPLLERVVQLFEESFFGKRPLPAERFDACWEQTKLLGTALRTPRELAA